MKEPSKEIQQKYMELQLIQHQLQQVQKQVQALDEQADEMDVVQQALADFSAAKPGSEMYVTVTPGVFAKAKLENNETVLLNVGAGAVVEKPVPDAKKIMAKQGTELRKMQEELTEQLQKLAHRGEHLQSELKKLIEKDV
ncbi:prefoldin subunit alpha [Candidatus Woesearchaeota archaeon CG10_big_fil_rev_8_21_14_0_10_37_12]|nr:MAG: prefoldin subunit alpha [Candidatus Woesearchaeota archaeon CG10_big_fil_rev_8_21_14_0_10_37_12]